MTTLISPRFLWRLVFALTVLPAISHAAGWDIDQLMRGLAQTRASHARFVETKTIAMLDEPVESSGELFYSAPDRLEKRTLRPRRESMLVDGSALLIEHRDGFGFDKAGVTGPGLRQAAHELINIPAGGVTDSGQRGQRKNESP